MNELFLYDRDDSLFKEVLKQSKTIQGRYHVSPNYGKDLNTDNLEQFLKDPAYGLTGPKQKYPIAVCMTPVSSFQSINGTKWEVFTFRLFFLTLANRDGNNHVKLLDKDTNTSGQHTWYDWADMKQAAADFLEVLQQVIKRKLVNNPAIPLRTMLNIDYERAQVTRLTHFNNDKLNGVSIAFTAMMYSDACEVRDYDTGYLNNIIIPAE